MFGQNKPSIFGNTSFGQSSPAATTGTGLFGTKPVGVSFGQQQQAPATGLFGAPAQQQPATGTMFGRPRMRVCGTPCAGGTSTNLFGTPSSVAGGSMFGSTTTNRPLFGATGTTGAVQPTNLFGAATAPAAATGGGLFGTNSSMFGVGTSMAPTGTTIKFEAMISTDSMLKNGLTQTTNTKAQCITMMKQYESKSLEELRCEDYAAGRRAPQQQQQQQQTLGLFGQSAAGTNLFGGAPAATASTSGLFGGAQSSFGQQPKPLTFGGTTSTIGGGLFGTAPAPQTTSLFGQSTAPAQTTGLFGQSTPAPALGGGLFGQTNTQPQQQQQQTSLFGQSKPITLGGGLFGSTTAPTQQAAPAFNFSGGQTQQTGGLFGTKPASTGTGLFGTATTNQPSAAFTFGSTTAQPSAGGGLFGSTVAKPAGGGLFGTAPAQQAPLGTGGLFGTTNVPTAGGGLFGTAQPAAAKSMFSFGGAQPAAAPTQFSFGGATTLAQPAQQQQQQQLTLGMDPTMAQAQQSLFAAQLAGLATSPYSDKLQKLLGPTDKEAAMSVTDPMVHKKILSQQYTSPTGGLSGTSIGARPFMSSANRVMMPPSRLVVSPHTAAGSMYNMSKQSTPNASIFDNLDDDENFLRDTSSNTLRRNRQSALNSDDTMNVSGSNALVASPLIHAQIANNDRALPSMRAAGVDRTALPIPLNLSQCETMQNDSRVAIGGGGVGMTLSNETVNETTIGGLFGGEYNEPSSPVHRVIDEDNEAVVKLTMSDYYTVPGRSELKTLKDERGCCVCPNGFTIGRTGFGSVFWPGHIVLPDNLHADAIVVFRHKEVTVYPDESTKPPVGQGLNRHAEITLERVWPVDKATRKIVTDVATLSRMQFRERLERTSVKMDAQFKDYRPDTGTWVFSVDHFSKYGLADEEEDNNSNDEENSVPARLYTKLVHDEQLQDRVQRAKIVATTKVAYDLRSDDERDTRIYNKAMQRNDHTIRTMTADNDVEDMACDAVSLQDLSSDTNALMDSVEYVHSLLSTVVQSPHAEIKPSILSYTQDPMVERDDDGMTNEHSLLAEIHNRSRKLLADVTCMMEEEQTEAADDNVNGGVDAPGTSDGQQLRTLPFPRRPKHASALLCTLDSSILRTLVRLEPQKLLVDVAATESRRSRVGFGVHGVYAAQSLVEYDDNTAPGFAPAAMKLAHIMYRCGVVDVRQRCIGGTTRPGARAQLIRSLIDTNRQTLSHVTHTDGDVLIARYTVTTIDNDAQLSLAIEAFVDVARKNREAMSVTEYASWQLCSVLWSEMHYMPAKPSDGVDDWPHRRRRAFNEWLAHVCEPQLNNDVAQIDKIVCIHEFLAHVSVLIQPSATARESRTILRLLQSGRTHQAATYAIERAHRPRTAATLSTLLVDSVQCQQLMKAQLEVWNMTAATGQMSDDEIAIHALCAGMLTVDKCDDRDRRHKGTVRPCDTLDWRRALAVHSCFICAPSLSIADVVDAYTTSFNNNTTGVCAPNSEQHTVNVCTDYQLLRLYAGEGGNIEQLLAAALDPLSYDSDEYRFGWHLYQLLAAVGYSALPDHAHDALCVRYADELSATASSLYDIIYVLMHIADPHVRAARVRQLLFDNANRLMSDKAAVDELLLHCDGLPPSVVYEALCLHARQTGRRMDECVYALHAEHYNLAHRLFVDNVAPVLVVNEDIARLKKLCTQLTAHSHNMCEWTMGGDVYVNYVALTIMLQQYTCDEWSVQDQESAKSFVVTLLGRLTCMRATSDVQRLALAEMSRRCALVCRVLAFTDNERDTLQPLLDALPLADEHKLDEIDVHAQRILHMHHAAATV